MTPNDVVENSRHYLNPPSIHPTMLRPLLALASLYLAAGLCRADVTTRSEQTFPARPDVVVSLTNVNGSIDIQGWDKPEVSLVAEKSAATAEALEKIKVQIDARPDHIAIKTDYPHRFFESSRGSVRYWLRVPTAASIDKIESVNCPIAIKGVEGSTAISSVNGKIAITGLSSSLSLETVNGSARIEATRLPAGSELKLHSVNGAIDLALPAQVSARFDISTVGGRVTSAFPLASSGFIGRTFHGTTGTGAARVQIDTVNGTVAITQR